MQVPNTRLSTLAASLLVAGLAPAAALAQVTFYEHDNYQGRAFTTDRSVGSLRDSGFNDRASSLVVSSQRWEVCDDTNFGGRCVVLRPGNYASLTDVGLNDRVSSVRLVGEAPRPPETRPLPPPAAPAPEAVVFYENANFKGRAFVTQHEVANFAGAGFNDRASSLVVMSNRWQVCEGPNYSGRCVVLNPGNYPSLTSVGLDNRVSSVRMVGVNNTPPQPAANLPDAVVFYEGDNFRGRTFGSQESVPNFMSYGFNDRASSIVVNSQRWEVCENANFGGSCVVLRPGRYASLAAMGLNDRISSVRMVGGGRGGEDRETPSRWQRRPNERLFVVPVSTVRAVVATPEQRCWIEQEPVAQSRSDNRNVPGAVVGAIIGGVLGHQVGGGRGRDIATAGGAVAGAVVGSRVGNDGNRVATQDVKRCETVPSTKATDYWDVSYTFRGREHNVQMSTPPGPTIMVNRDGEPRV